MSQITNSAQPNRGCQARGAEPLTWFRTHADMTHEQPSPLRTILACIFLSRRDRYSYLHWSGYRTSRRYPKNRRTRSTCEPCSCYRPGKVLRGAMHRDACANLTCHQGPAGQPRGARPKACFIPRRSHLTHGTYVLWLSDQWVESKSNDQLVTTAMARTTAKPSTHAVITFHLTLRFRASFGYCE